MHFLCLFLVCISICICICVCISILAGGSRWLSGPQAALRGLLRPIASQRCPGSCLATVSTLASQAAAKGFVCSQPDRSHQDIFCLPPTLSIVFLHLPLLLPPKGFVHIEARRRMPNKGNRIYKIVKQKYREAVGRGLLRRPS